MGISKAALQLFRHLGERVPLKGSIGQLGRQSIDVTGQYFRDAFAGKAVDLAGAKVDDISFFKALGFSTVESLDYSDYEGATHLLDLNNPIPDGLKERYDVIFDGGTTEHIFNLPESLRNIFRMLKPGGIVIHESPSTKHVDHGFYMFSPTLFYDWYTANRFEIIQAFLFEYSMDYNKPWTIYEYQPGTLDAFSFVGLGGSKRVGIWFVARKVAGATCDATPQQGAYLSAWQADAGDVSARPVSALRRFLRRQKPVRALATRVYPLYRRFFRRMPRVVAKY